VQYALEGQRPSRWQFRSGLSPTHSVSDQTHCGPILYTGDIGDIRAFKMKLPRRGKPYSSSASRGALLALNGAKGHRTPSTPKPTTIPPWPFLLDQSRRPAQDASTRIRQLVKKDPSYALAYAGLAALIPARPSTIRRYASSDAKPKAEKPRSMPCKLDRNWARLTSVLANVSFQLRFGL